MKVFILAGGLGTRMREETEHKPKPMVRIGGQPVLWHIMKNLSASGFREFVVLAGYKGEIIKEYFANYMALRGNVTFDLSNGDILAQGLSLDESKWKVTVLDTGLDADTGDRVIQGVNAVAPGEPFMVVYGDSLANVNLKNLLATHQNEGRLATVTAVRARSRFGQLKVRDRQVMEFLEKPLLTDLISIGFFVFEPESIQYLLKGGALEANGISELANAGELSFFEHDGFWKAMDTFREYEEMSKLWDEGAPWKTW